MAEQSYSDFFTTSTGASADRNGQSPANNKSQGGKKNGTTRTSTTRVQSQKVGNGSTTRGAPPQLPGSINPPQPILNIKQITPNPQEVDEVQYAGYQTGQGGATMADLGRFLEGSHPQSVSLPNDGSSGSMDGKIGPGANPALSQESLPVNHCGFPTTGVPRYMSSLQQQVEDTNAATANAAIVPNSAMGNHSIPLPPSIAAKLKACMDASQSQVGGWMPGTLPSSGMNVSGTGCPTTHDGQNDIPPKRIRKTITTTANDTEDEQDSSGNVRGKIETKTEAVYFLDHNSNIVQTKSTFSITVDAEQRPGHHLCLPLRKSVKFVLDNTNLQLQVCDN